MTTSSAFSATAEPRARSASVSMSLTGSRHSARPTTARSRQRSGRMERSSRSPGSTRVRRRSRRATRALDAGARGIKLHPRSQAFALDDDWLGPIFALAAERSVPILIHGGRGLPPIAEQLAHLCDTHDGTQLIIAHAGVADLLGLARLLSGRPGVFFDTSVWSVLDLLELLRNVGPEQVVYASDYPYGRLPGSLLLALKGARRAGLDDHQVRDLMGGTASRIADGAEPRTPTAPLDFNDGQPITLARIHTTSRWQSRCCGPANPSRLGCSGSRETPARSCTTSPTHGTAPASSSRPQRTSGQPCTRWRTTRSGSSSSVPSSACSTWPMSRLSRRRKP